MKEVDVEIKQTIKLELTQEQLLSALRLAGLKLPAGARVLVSYYDEEHGQEADATVIAVAWEVSVDVGGLRSA